MNDKGRRKLENVKAYQDPVYAKWKRKSIHGVNSENRSEVGIEEKKTDVDIQEAENKINAISRRINCFTIFILIVTILVSTGIILYRGGICISK